MSRYEDFLASLSKAPPQSSYIQYGKSLPKPPAHRAEAQPDQQKLSTKNGSHPVLLNLSEQDWRDATKAAAGAGYPTTTAYIRHVLRAAIHHADLSKPAQDAPTTISFDVTPQLMQTVLRNYKWLGYDSVQDYMIAMIRDDEDMLFAQAAQAISVHPSRVTEKIKRKLEEDRTDGAAK